MAETNPSAMIAPTAIHETTQSPSQPPSITTINGTTNRTTNGNPTPSSPTTKKQDFLGTQILYPKFTIPPELPVPPFIDVSGVPNFRSLGGYLSANGRTIVRHDLFYRCGHPTQITPEGLEFLTTTLGVKAIYDLRSEGEVDRTSATAVANAAAFASTNPASPPPPIPYLGTLFQSLRHFTPVYTTEDTGPEALARKLAWYRSATTPASLPYPYSEGFVNAYRDIASHGAPAYTTIFRHILTRPTDPFVFHCTAGKDRTGVFAALILRLAGIDDETICWEYATTEPGLGEWRRHFIARMTSGGGLHGTTSSKPLSREEAARICGARAGNMRAWLTLVLDGEWGGAERYLHEKCGFTDEEIVALKDRIVVDVRDPSSETDGVSIVRPSPIRGWTMDGGCEDI